MRSPVKLFLNQIRRVLTTTGVVVLTLVSGAGIAGAVASGDYLDEFNAIAYDGSDGGIDWKPDPWSELGEADGPTGGRVRVVTNSRCDGGVGNCLRIGGDEVNISGRGAVREADLAGAGSATLSYSYRRQILDDPGGSVAAEISGDGGGSWNTLVSYSLNTSDGTNVVETFDISAYIAANTQIRFIGSGEVAAYIYFDNVEIEVEGNQAPVLNPVGDKTVDEQTLLSFTATASDPDVPADTLTFTLTGAPTGASITSGGVFTWTPSEAQGPGVFIFDVVVTDDGTPNLSDSETITVTVNEVNVVPVLNPVGDKTVDEQTLLSFTATASDPDVPADTLTFTLAGAPTGASITSGGVFTWTPTEAQGPGVFIFDVVVTDDGIPNLSDSETIAVTVNEMNVAPTANSIGGQFVDEGDTVSLTATATDPDVPANTLTWSLDSGPGSVDGAGNYTWVTAETDGPGTYTVVLRVTDNGTPNLSDTVSFTVTVDEVNVAPVLNPVGAQTVDEGTLLTFTASATDPDVPANTLTFTLAGAPTGASITSGGVFTWTPTEAQGPGVFSFDVVVTDDGIPNLSDSETIAVTVNEMNVAPTANSIGGQFVDEGDTVSLTATATDPDVPANTLTWSLDSGPGSVDGAGNYTWVTAETDGPGTYTVVLRVTDNGTPNLSDTVSFTVTVDEVNVVPVLNPVGDKTVDEQTLLSFTATASDPDVPADTLTFTLAGAPTGASITSGGVFTWTPTEAQGPGVFSFDVVVTDDGTPNLSDSETITVTVNAVNDLPVGGPDAIVLSSYLPRIIPVLANDTDADLDALFLQSIIGDTTGTVTINADGTITYSPQSGWVGTETFSYVLSDGNGGTDTVLVSITIPPSVLATSDALTKALGTLALPFVAPGSNRNDPDVIGLEFGLGVRLLSEVFFQSLGALRLPLAFLVLALVVVFVLGGLTELPTLIAARRRRYRSVVLLEREEQLPVRNEPGANQDILYNYEPTAAGFLSLDKPKRVGDAAWTSVESPGGDGWVETSYVSEAVDLQYFLTDERPVQMVRQLADALAKGGDFTNLLAPRGLAIALTNRPRFIPSDELGSLLNEIRLQGARPSGLSPLARELRDEVFEPLRLVLHEASEIDSAASHSPASLIPVELWNFQYLVVSAPNHNPWLIYFEYLKHKPYIVGFGIDV